ncbi:MAG: carboxypeptidase-like regulatory domain-containing protein [Planctomycetes bacterium]|nr:carboxypeptidase-like regulatory domain-containing protein [Planctomycetota bacterium]
MGSHRKILLLFAACLALGAGLLVFLSGDDGGQAAPIEVITPGGVGPEIDMVARVTRDEELASERELEGEEPTEIFFPLELSLSLVEPAKRLVADGVGAHGSGARARLEGHLFGPDSKGVTGEVRFTSGANMGRVLKCDAGGGFGAHDLYPGLSIVKVSGALIPGAEREVLLRNDRKSVLNIGFGRPAVVHGRVQDKAGDPIIGARVTMDGQETYTDQEGTFYYPRMTSGQVLLIVEKEGYAAWREKYNVKAGATITGDKLVYTLRPGAALELRIAESLGARQPAQVFLLPAAGARTSRDFPWHRYNPVSVYPGGTSTVEGLPPGNLQLYLFHAGARAKPRVSAVSLKAGRLTKTVLHLEPAPVLKGRVLRDGEPVSRALVRLEAPDQVQTTLSTFGQPAGFLEVGVFPNLPTSVQSTWSDPAGRFTFSSNEQVTPIRYLTAEGPDGETWAGEIVRRGASEVELELKEIPPDACVIEFQMEGRELALPVQVSVDGAPRVAVSLPAEENFQVDELAKGRWRVNARWNSQPLLRDVIIDLEDETALLIPLPDAAKSGGSALFNPARR